MKTKSKTPFLDACASISYESECIQTRKSSLLARRGWKMTCDTPGALWLYEKQLPDGKTVLCGLDLAIEIEKTLCGEHYDEAD